MKFLWRKWNRVLWWRESGWKGNGVRIGGMVRESFCEDNIWGKIKWLEELVML